MAHSCTNIHNTSCIGLLCTICTYLCYLLYLVSFFYLNMFQKEIIMFVQSDMYVVRSFILIFHDKILRIAFGFFCSAASQDASVISMISV